MDKKKILILNSQYIPGYKGGGPVKSIKNLVENFKDKYNFYILTSDRDLNDDKPYDSIKHNEWNEVSGALVYYMSLNEQSLHGFNDIINSIDIDMIILNNFFHPIFTMKPLILNKFGKLKCKNIVMTPRGDFSIGHLKLKAYKKIPYICVAKLTGLYKGLKWHVTSELEYNDLKRIFKKENNIEIAANLNSSLKISTEKKIKTTGILNLVFISRIVKKKNLKYCLEILKMGNFCGNINFDIYGPIEDKSYWNECELIIKSLPNNIIVNYRGGIENSKVIQTLEKYQVFFFPTLGENFGHVIVEAISSRCILLISDQTPWRELEKEGIGFDINLENKSKFIKTIENLINMDNNEYEKFICNITNFYNKNLTNEKALKAYDKMLKKYLI